MLCFGLYQQVGLCPLLLFLEARGGEERRAGKARLPPIAAVSRLLAQPGFMRRQLLDARGTRGQKHGVADEGRCGLREALPPSLCSTPLLSHLSPFCFQQSTRRVRLSSIRCSTTIPHRHGVKRSPLPVSSRPTSSATTTRIPPGDTRLPPRGYRESMHLGLRPQSPSSTRPLSTRPFPQQQRPFLTPLPPPRPPRLQSSTGTVLRSVRRVGGVEDPR